MKSFIQRHSSKITGILSGFDRLVFRGTLRRLTKPGGMMSYLWYSNVLLKNFREHVLETTAKLKGNAERLGRDSGRPLVYLPSAAARKEEIARDIAKRDGVKEGLICILTSVEPCVSFEIYKNQATKRLELLPRRRKCLHYYQYWLDPELGLMNARLESWFPFNIQVCVNGREWLARSMDKAGLGYVKRDNCFTWLEDAAAAQALMDAQLRTDWPAMLATIAGRLNPAHAEIFAHFPVEYYWSVFQSEWATDLMFKDAAALAALYPTLIRHGITSFGSADVLRFLGHKVPATGFVRDNLKAEVTSDLKRRPEGMRIKHRLGANSVKAYDKQGSVLRVETTINDAEDFKVYRPKEGGAKDDLAWRQMRRGVADAHRRAEVSQASNERYLEALSAAEEGEPLGKLAGDICRPVTRNGRRHRALNPYSPEDAVLLEAINRGEFAINGLRNRDLRGLLKPEATTPVERKKASAAITRQLALLRAHGLIKKVPHTHRYQVTTKGRNAITALLAARAADVNKLTKLAA